MNWRRCAFTPSSLAAIATAAAAAVVVLELLTIYIVTVCISTQQEMAKNVEHGRQFSRSGGSKQRSESSFNIKNIWNVFVRLRETLLQIQTA